MYVKPFCPYCIRAQRLLDEKGIPYETYTISYAGPERQEMIQRSGGRTTVPQIFIACRHVGGCDELMSLQRNGRLDELLAA